MAKLSSDNIAKYRPQTRNGNKHTQRGMGMLESSMRQYGYVSPMTAAADGEIIDGSARIETSANVFGDDAIIVHHDGTKPVIMVRDDIPSADTPEARAISMAANRIAQVNLDFDAEVILQDLAAGVDLEQFWRKDELDELLADLQPKTTGDTPAETDRAEELRQKWGTAPGQLWQLGEHRLVCGDCTDAATVARVMGGEAYVLVTDPPYGIKASAMTMGSHQSSLPKEQRLSNVERWDDERPDVLPFVTAAKAACVWGGQYFANDLPISDDWLCWHKKNDGLSFAECELAWTNYGCRTRILQHHWGDEKKQHITQKPLGVMAWCIELSPDKTAAIFDPFLGSGTTIIACENLSRRCRACEISPAYVAVALERWSVHTGRQPVLVEGA